MNGKDSMVPVVRVVADQKTIDGMMAESVGSDSGEIDELISEDWRYSMELMNRISEANRLSAE